MPTRLVSLKYTSSGSGDRVPLDVIIFYDDTVYRVLARVRPTLSWLGLLDALLRVIREDINERVPHTLFRYFVYNLKYARALETDEEIGASDTGCVLYLHDSEFRNAVDKQRRAVLVLDMIKQFKHEHLDPTLERRRLAGTADERPETPEAEAPAEDPVPSEGEPARKAEVEPKQREEAAGPSLYAADDSNPSAGGWAQWHRSYGERGAA